MQYSTFFYVPGAADWDSSTSDHSHNFVPTPPGWRFLSNIEVSTDDQEQWWMSNLYSFLEQWTGTNGLAERSGLYGPAYLAEETGSFVQITSAHFRHGQVENYKHVNAWSDDSGSVGLEMGGNITRNVFNDQLFEFPVARMPEALQLFLPMKECISELSTEASTAEIEACLQPAPVPATAHRSHSNNIPSPAASNTSSPVASKASASKASKTSPTLHV